VLRSWTTGKGNVNVKGKGSGKGNVNVKGRNALRPDYALRPVRPDR